MKTRIFGAALTALLGLGLAGAAQAQDRPTLVIMPASYFSADEASADNLTQGLTEQFERQGYRVISMDRARSTFQSQGLSRTRHYADRTALQFGRAAGADLVVYPRLLALGIPAANAEKTAGTMLEPSAVVHVRVLNVSKKAPIYFRQIGHEFASDTAPAEVAAEFRLPQPVATAAATEATEMYFQRVAGSRQERRSK